MRHSRLLPCCHSQHFLLGIHPGSCACSLALLFGCSAQFADPFGLAQDRSGGAQTRGACPEIYRRAQTTRVFSPESPALLGHTTRPGETSGAMSPVIIIAAQLAEPVLSFAEGLKQGSPVFQSVHQESRAAGVGYLRRERMGREGRRAETV